MGRQLKVAFCVSGRGSLFRAAVLKAPDIGITPQLLVTETRSSADLDTFALDHGISHSRLDPVRRELFDRELTRVLLESKVDLIVLTFDRIIPPAVVRRYERRIINVHPALLPAFSGMHGIEQTLSSGVRIGGATIHEVIDAIDAGPIVAQAAVATIPNESMQAYGGRMYALLEPMFLSVLRWYAEGRVAHDSEGRTVVQGADYGTLPVSPTLP